MDALPSVITKLADLLSGEYNLQKGVEREIRFLQSAVNSMKDALFEIYSIMPDQRHDEATLWATEMSQLSYIIDDTIEIFMISYKSNKSVYLHDIFVRWKVQRDFATSIRGINSKIKDLCQRQDRHRIIKMDYSVEHVAIDPRLPALYVSANQLVGIDEAREELVQILMGDRQMSKHQDKIVSIVGIGGLGKTTLAKAVYDDKLRAQFDCSAFVTVSQNPHMLRVLNDILFEVDGYKHGTRIEINDIKTIIDKLRNFLHDKRYFIVFDDIWDIKAWDIIRCALPSNNIGYNIITTTRSFEVAKYIGGVYKLKPLSLSNSRKLLYKRALNNDQDNNEDTELAEVVDGILRKCGGVPLAIITVGGLLECKPTNEWYETYNSIGAVMETNEAENMRKILSFSYYDLPYHLRKCLLYLSMFPEDYEIDKDSLIWMWIAEGFIDQCQNRYGQFELGESYFNKLINRSMIHRVNGWNSTMMQYYRVHDMILDLLRSLSSEENFVSVLNGVHCKSVSDRVLRLSLQNRTENFAMPVDVSVNMRHLRSVSVFPSSVSRMPPLSSFKVLRVMNLENYCLREGYSLNSIGNLFHLRFLRLRGTGIAQLPEEIGNLQFLQTLDVTGNGIYRLPSTVVLLKHLMCLRIDSWTRIPNGIGSLTSLEELSMLCIDNFTDIIEEFRCLTELRVLSIDCGNGCDFNSPEIPQVECLLDGLEKIESIYISVFGECNLLDAWDRPRHLRRLEISGCWSSMLPAWMRQPKLLNLSLISIEMRKLCQDDLEVLGMLPGLSFLDLEVDHENLEFLGIFVIGANLFPSLVHCVLRGSLGLVEFRPRAMPRLTSLCLTFPVCLVGEMADSSGGFDLGLGNLLSLQDVTISFLYGDNSRGDVETVEAVLSHAIETHPNHPTLQIR